MDHDSPVSSSVDTSRSYITPPPEPASASSIRHQHYRLATSDELQRGVPLSAALVRSDGSLATPHCFTPLSYGNEPSEASTPPLLAPPLADDAVSCTKHVSAATQQDAKPLLLLSSGSMVGGNQGVLYFAYCADAPFQFVAKYSHPGGVCREMVAYEAVFYRRNGPKLAAEKLAPRFIGGWSAEREASPYSDGSATTIILVEEWGQRVAEWEWCDVDRETRQAVLDLAIRFHLKMGYRHGSLRCDNILSQPNIGPSSLRLIDFARSGESCICMEGECCEELYKLRLALHRVETYELVKARCEAEKVERALAAVGEAERELRGQATREAELAASNELFKFGKVTFLTNGLARAQQHLTGRETRNREA
ncbi:hypothetical protein JCM10296v2_007442 [Rhodotorula toruloides]